MIGRVQDVARMSLSDDGYRSLSEATDTLLDRDYEGWRDPRRTTMLPRVFSKTKVDRGIAAEKKIFQLLSNFTEEPMFVVHSFKFEELIDGDTVKGEHDFAIIHRRQGLIFFQVKASEHFSSSKYGDALEQMKKDYQVTDFSLRTVAGRGQLPDLAPFRRGYAVMPNCPRPEDPNVMGLFQQDCRDAASFGAWWESHINASTMDFPQELYEHLIRRFVGNLHIVPPPSQQWINKTLKEIDGATSQHFKKMENVQIATKQQLEALTIHRPRLWVTGPAGSGKTWLLLHKVHHLANTGCTNILVLCYNRPLSLYLERELGEYVDVGTIRVMTYDKFLLDYLGIPVKSPKYEKLRRIAQVCYWQQVSRKFNHIFVDEGQDLYGFWPELLELFLEKDPSSSVESPHFWVMFDPNQHVQPTATHCSHYRQQLEESLKLEDVLRNPKKVFNLSQKFYSAPLGLCHNLKLGHKVTGPPVFWSDPLTGDYEKDVKKMVTHLNSIENVPLREICILTQDRQARNLLISALQSIPVHCQNAEGHIYDNNNNAVIVESIRRFKGLESKVVMLFNPSDDQELLYVALTRCNCYLAIFSSKALSEWIQGNG